MPVFPSMISLHLRYRIWIAEMNFDINVIRIYKDYLSDLSANDKLPGVASQVKQFEATLETFRADIDELKNEMHLLKMKLASYTRKQKEFDYPTYKSDDHAALRTGYIDFRKKFESLKSELSMFVTTMNP